MNWQHPLWLLIAFIPLPLYGWVLLSKSSLRLTAFADAHLLPSLITGLRHNTRIFNRSFLLAWALAAVAAAGPYWVTDNSAAIQHRAMDIAVAIDISPSMAVQDLTPSRLARVKQELKDFTRRAHQARLSLITFSANAYVALPLTSDLEAFYYFVEQLDPSLAALQGSNVAKALDLASSSLEGSDINSRAIILVTDGELHDLGAIAAAKRLRDKNIPLLILGVGTTTGGPVPDETGRFIHYQDKMVISQASPTLNASLASAANGLFSNITSDDADWDLLFTKLDKLQANTPYMINQRATIKLAPWILALSLLLFLWSSVRKSLMMVFIILPVLFILPSAPTLAAPWNEQQARDALLAGDYAQASLAYRELQNTYVGNLGLGAIAYRQGKWSEALALFQQADTLATTATEHAHAIYNRGNALSKLDRLQEAQAAYRAALSWQSNFPRAALNLSLVTKALQLATADNQYKGLSLKEQQAQTGDMKSGNQSNMPDSNVPKAAKQQVDLATAQGVERSLKPLAGLRDDAGALLRKRFSRDDREAGQIIVTDKPW